MAKSPSIAPLTKVSLNLKAVTDGTDTSSAAPTNTLSFICGIATEGLTAFEKELHGMVPGDQISLRIDAATARQFLEHLWSPLLAAVQASPPYDLLIEVVTVTPASDRELVHALARKVESGQAGCGCDCGCG